MITENDKFEIPDKYKQMTLKELRKEKDILYINSEIQIRYL